MMHEGEMAAPLSSSTSSSVPVSSAAPNSESMDTERSSSVVAVANTTSLLTSPGQVSSNNLELTTQPELLQQPQQQAVEMVSEVSTAGDVVVVSGNNLKKIS